MGAVSLQPPARSSRAGQVATTYVPKGTVPLAEDGCVWVPSKDASMAVSIVVADLMLVRILLLLLVAGVVVGNVLPRNE